jgi:MFS transporter, FHS family, L-fucose permease
MSVSDSNRRHALRLVTSLFFMWGLAYGLLDVLNKHFQESLSVSRAHSAYLQAAYFGAYFLMALPAAWLMRRRGYKFGILLGLCLYALGALLFAPATLCGSFDFFLLALFVIACGLACLETAANPYVAIMGDPALAERRLNFAQSFNGLGSFIGPLIGGALFFSRATVGPVSIRVPVTYAAIAVVVLVIAALILRHFAGAVVAQFCYVAAQVGVGTFFINYVTEHQKSIDSSHASFLLSIGLLAFLVGRFTSTALMRRVAPSTLLTLYAVINIALCAIVALAAGPVAIAALIAIFFFMSIMFPTIFALGVARLGAQTKSGAAYLVMSIVGGAIAPYFMGMIADARGTAAAYWVPGACFAIVAWYGYAQRPARI